MEKEKGCSTAYLDSSPTVITAFTELGGAEPLVEVLKGCDELSCSQYSALNNSTYPIQYSMVAYRQTTETRSRIGQTPNYSECLVRTHPSLTGPGMAILCIKCNSHWLCVLTLVIFSTIAQFSADKTVSVARAPAWTLAGGFNVIGPTHASNELKNLPHEHVLIGSNNSSLPYCIAIQAWKVPRWHG